MIFSIILLFSSASSGNNSIFEIVVLNSSTVPFNLSITGTDIVLTSDAFSERSRKILRRSSIFVSNLSLSIFCSHNGQISISSSSITFRADLSRLFIDSSNLISSCKRCFTLLLRSFSSSTISLAMSSVSVVPNILLSTSILSIVSVFFTAFSISSACLSTSSRDLISGRSDF